MTAQSNEMILNTSDAAAKRVTVSGWVSRDGRFYGDDERTARWAGATHVACPECGQPTDKSYTHCEACRNRRSHERFEALPLAEWDGVTPLALWDTDQYFFLPDEVYDYAEEHGVKASELELVLCKPIFAHQLDIGYWCDEFPEDGDAPTWLEDAIEQFNAILDAHKDEPLSWLPGKERVRLPGATGGEE